MNKQIDRKTKISSIISTILFLVGVSIIIFGYLVSYLNFSVLILDVKYMYMTIGMFIIGILCGIYSEKKDFLIPLNIFGIVLSFYATFVLFLLGQFI